MVYDISLALGYFTAKDCAMLHAPAPTSKRWERQFHLRKNHSVLWIFERTEQPLVALGQHGGNRRAKKATGKGDQAYKYISLIERLRARPPTRSGVWRRSSGHCCASTWSSGNCRCLAMGRKGSYTVYVCSGAGLVRTCQARAGPTSPGTMRTSPHCWWPGDILRQNDSSRGRRAHRRPRPFWLGGCAYAAGTAPHSTRGKERRYARVWVKPRARDGRRRDRRRPGCAGAWLALGVPSVGAWSALYRDRGGRGGRVSLCALPVASCLLSMVPQRVRMQRCRARQHAALLSTQPEPGAP